MAVYESSISKLPDELLHKIMSKISVKYCAKTSILSKRWNYLWQTLFILNFDEEFYFSLHENKKRKQKESELLMQKTEEIILNRIQQQEEELITNLQELFWIIPLHEKWEAFNLGFEKLIQSLSNTRLQQISIINYNCKESTCEFPNLPSLSIFPKSITKLHLSRIELGGLKSLLPISYKNIVKFWYLRTLNLSMIKIIDEEIVNEHLKVICPSLEDLTIHGCDGIENLYLTRLLKLKRLCVSNLLIDTVKLEVLPQLEILIIDGIGILEAELNNTLCDSVRHLQLLGDFLNNDLLNKFVSKCGLLEYLEIGSESNCLEEINISNETIKSLSIAYVKKIAKINIKTPMLQQFAIEIDVVNIPPTISWTHSNSSLIQVCVSVFPPWYNRKICTPNDDKLDIWRNFFEDFNHVKALKLKSPPLLVDWLQGEGSTPYSPFLYVEDIIFINKNHKFSSIVQLLKFLIFLTPKTKSLTLIENVSKFSRDIIFKFVYDEEKVGKTSIFDEFQFFGIEFWLQSVSEVKINKFIGGEDELKMVTNFFNNKVKKI